MKIYYQWVLWSYSNLVAKKLQDVISTQSKTYWKLSFKEIFQQMKNNNLWIIPIENSYSWSLHENFHNLVTYPVKIVWQYYKPINHSLLSTGKDIWKIKYAYSHPQALMQCENFLKKHKIKPLIYSDTASAAKYIKEQKDKKFATIASKECWQIYSLNTISEDIQDQDWNTTRFFIISYENANIEFSKTFYEIFNSTDSPKMSLIFKARHQPASLYKVLGCFATRNINLTKIESLPTKNNPFSYMFWIDIDVPSQKDTLKYAFEELEFFTNYTKILWKY